MIETEKHRNRIYAGETQALSLTNAKANTLRWVDAMETAEALYGSRVLVAALPAERVAEGVIGLGMHHEGLAIVLVVNPEKVSDIILAHEVAHLTAEGKGHGAEWVAAYVQNLRHLGHDKAAEMVDAILGTIIEVAAAA